MALQSQLEPSVHAERYHAVAEIAEMWKLIADKVRELFDRELGVLAIELLFVGVCPDRVETVQSLRLNPKNRVWSGRPYA